MGPTNWILIVRVHLPRTLHDDIELDAVTEIIDRSPVTGLGGRGGYDRRLQGGAEAAVAGPSSFHLGEQRRRAVIVGRIFRQRVAIEDVRALVPQPHERLGMEEAHAVEDIDGARLVGSPLQQGVACGLVERVEAPPSDAAARWVFADIQDCGDA